MKIFIPIQQDIEPDAMNLLRNYSHELITEEFERIDNTPIENEIEAIFTRAWYPLYKEDLDKFPKLKYILQAASGLDNIDIEECKRRNITILSARGENASAVAEFVISMSIYILRNIDEQKSHFTQREMDGVIRNLWETKLHLRL